MSSGAGAGLTILCTVGTAGTSSPTHLSKKEDIIGVRTCLIPGFDPERCVMNAGLNARSVLKDVGERDLMGS